MTIREASRVKNGTRGGRPAKSAVAVLLACLAALVLAGQAAADWPVYGHDLSNTRNGGAEGPPASQVPTLSQAWAFKASTGDFTGTPVIADGVVVAGNNGGWVYALDAVNGNVLWSKNVGQPVNGSAAIDIHAPGGPLVYVPVDQLGSPRLLALSLANGATRWDAVLTNQANTTVFGSPTFWNGTVYVGTAGPNEDTSNARGSLVAIDEATGRIRWQMFTVTPGHDGAAVWSTPAIDPATGRLYVGTGNNYHAPTTDTEDAIVAVNALTGQMLAHYQATANDTFSGGNHLTGPDADFGASPNLFTAPNGEPLVGEGQKSGNYWALDRNTMQPVWHTSVGPAGLLGGVLGSTAFDGTHIFTGDTVNGQITGLARGGLAAWTSFDAGGNHLAPLSVANGVLYTNDTSGFTTARDPATGLVIGKLPIGGPTYGGIAADGRALYVSQGVGPQLQPLPQNDPPGAIVAFGDTSHSGGNHGLTGRRGGSAGRGQTASVVVLPSTRRCVGTRGLTFRVRPNHRVRKIEVLVNGRRRLVIRPRGRGRVTIHLASGRKSVVTVIVIRRDGTRLITTRRYAGCKVARSRTRVRHRHRRR
jgi:polyvinyl alcohol dehydrogenase (cytochrome)